MQLHHLSQGNQLAFSPFDGSGNAGTKVIAVTTCDVAEIEGGHDHLFLRSYLPTVVATFGEATLRIRSEKRSDSSGADCAVDGLSVAARESERIVHRKLSMWKIKSASRVGCTVNNGLRFPPAFQMRDHGFSS
jgi:hypothetical protein